MISDIITQFRNEMAIKGIIYSGEIKVNTNKIERFDVDGDKSGSLKGYYTLHTDNIPVGIFGAWNKNGKDYFLWSAKSRNEMTQSERKKHTKKIEELKKLRDEEKKKRHEAAKKTAQERLSRATLVTSHIYLTKKSIEAHGLLYDFNESKKHPTLLIPLHDIKKDIQTLQRVFWNDVEQDFSKKFLYGSDIKGNHYLFGEINNPTEVILLCEGWATGASIYEAINYPTFCAFDCWNLIEVAKLVREQYPQAKIVICGDDDTWPDKNGDTKENIGRKDAEEAAKAVNAGVVFPNFKLSGISNQEIIEKRPTDFNDIVSKLNFGGSLDSALAEVKRQITQYIKTMKISTRLPENFHLSDNGLFFLKIDNEGNNEKIFICSKIEITAYLRDTESTNWGRLLEFCDANQIHHIWGMPMSMLKGSGEELRGELLNRGLLFGYGNLAKNKFLEYITCSVPAIFARCVSRVGWYREDENHVFVLPDKTIGQSKEKIVYQTESPASPFKKQGSLDDWKNNVAKYCIGNSRLILAVSCAFAPMLLELVGEDSGGINYFGASSTGKTTALRIATSVFSSPDYLSRWRATVNGLEAQAAAHNDCLLPLDELVQVDPKDAGNAIYTLANGTGKSRANQYGNSRTRNEWRILFLPSGEIDLNQHISDGGKKITAGQQVRCIDIYADAGKGLGIFENLHGYDSGAVFSNHLKEMSARYYGTPFIAFLEQIIKPEVIYKIQKEWKEARARFLNANIKNDADGQVTRVSNRLALIAYAGELATEYGLTGWEKGSAVAAIQSCLATWIKYRGGTNSGEEMALLTQIKHIIESHDDSRFDSYEKSDKSQPFIRDRLGFKETVPIQNDEVTYRYYVLSSGFTELHKGHSKDYAIDVLKKVEWLLITDGKANQSCYIPALGKKVRCYVFNDSMWSS